MDSGEKREVETSGSSHPQLLAFGGISLAAAAAALRARRLALPCVGKQLLEARLIITHGKRQGKYLCVINAI